MIKIQNQSINSLKNEKYNVKNEIRDLETKKDNYLDNINSILDIKEKYRIKSLKYKPSNSNVDEKLLNLEVKCRKLKKESENLSNLASKLLNLEEWEDSLRRRTLKQVGRGDQKSKIPKNNQED